MVLLSDMHCSFKVITECAVDLCLSGGRKVMADDVRITCSQSLLSLFAIVSACLGTE